MIQTETAYPYQKLAAHQFSILGFVVVSLVVLNIFSRNYWSAVTFGVPTRVFTLEHLLAIMIKAGRPKDMSRIPVVLASTKPDPKRLNVPIESGETVTEAGALTLAAPW